MTPADMPTAVLALRKLMNSVSAGPIRYPLSRAKLSIRRPDHRHR